MVMISLSASPACGPRFLAGCAFWPQHPTLPMRAKGLAKIIELAEILHEPVEHECLRPLMAPTQKEELKGDKSLASPQTHNSGFFTAISLATMNRIRHSLRSHRF